MSFHVEQFEYLKYRVVSKGEDIGTIRKGDTPGVSIFHYENDRVKGTEFEIGEAARIRGQ